MNTRTPNRLINESSPYLLQHAHNPVDWYPWCDDAFEKARREDKPVFLSIGYSTCHWCHVMEKESFEDDEVAAIMNQHFVSIKVDREERPDIDNIYMMVCQLMNGNGGWPLSIFMTHDRKPFFSGTYFPKEDRYGRTGFKNLLMGINSFWLNRRNELLESSEQITFYLNEIYKKEIPARQIDEAITKNAFEYFLQRFDNEYGGFGTAPKFPSPHNLMFLLRYWKISGNQSALDIVTKTLLEMRKGGIYDHVGFGFHRYSTDRHWLLPHFEKMIYDQALLIIAYAKAFQATGEIIFKNSAEEIIEYILRDMRSPESGFYSAEDADSEGVEGKFYLWTHKEIFDLLEKDDAEQALNYFNVSANGNFADESTREFTGNNILHISNYDKDLSNKLIRKLFEQREKRIHPFKDQKILADWNALVISALSIAGRILDNESYIQRAVECYKFISTKMFVDKNLLMHRYKDGKAEIDAKLDDYSFLIWALTELYQSTFSAEYLLRAVELCDYTITHFSDASGVFFFSPDYGEKLIVRSKEIYDGAIPSGNSVMFNNLIRLARITVEPRYEEFALKLISNFSAEITKAPGASAFLLCGIDFLLGNSYEVIVSHNHSRQEIKTILDQLNKLFLPNKVVIINNLANDTEHLPFDYLKDYKVINDNPTFYVCKNHECKLPTNDLNEAINFIK